MWKFSERIAAQIVSLIVTIVLARLLLPEDYSVVSIVAVFFAFADVLVSGGLSTALIQKKDADRLDYSTILYVSVGISLVIYGVFFFVAPYVARVYEKEILVAVIRVMGLVLIPNAIKSILCAYVSNCLEFKKFFFSTIGGTVISGVVGILMAKAGLGPWALVVQQMINTIVGTLILIIVTRFKPMLAFSWVRLKGLFQYGWKIFATNIIDTIYNEINPLIVGLRYTPVDLSYYSKGQSFPKLINTTMSDTFASVLFPVMSKVQDDKNQLLNMTRRFMQISTYFVFPMMVGFFAISDNFVSSVLTEKWMPASMYIRIFCLSGMFTIVTKGNLQVIKASGRSDILLILEIIKKVLYFIVIVLFVFFSESPEIFALASLINSLIALMVNCIPNRTLIGYRFRKQLKDIVPNLLLACIMGVAVYLMNYINLTPLVLMILQILVGGLVYLFISAVFRPIGFLLVFQSMKDFIAKRKG